MKNENSTQAASKKLVADLLGRKISGEPGNNIIVWASAEDKSSSYSVIGKALPPGGTLCPFFEILPSTSEQHKQ